MKPKRGLTAILDHLCELNPSEPVFKVRISGTRANWTYGWDVETRANENHFSSPHLSVVALLSVIDVDERKQACASDK